METFSNNGENSQKKRDGSCCSSSGKVVKNKTLTSSTGSCSSDLTAQGKTSLPVRKATTVFKCSNSDEKENEPVSQVEDKKIAGISSKVSGKLLNFFISCFYKFKLPFGSLFVDVEWL